MEEKTPQSLNNEINHWETDITYLLFNLHVTRTENNTRNIIPMTMSKGQNNAQYYYMCSEVLIHVLLISVIDYKQKTYPI